MAERSRRRRAASDAASSEDDVDRETPLRDESEDEAALASMSEHEDSEVERQISPVTASPDLGLEVDGPVEDRKSEPETEGEPATRVEEAVEGQEGPVDDDLDRRNPQYIPKKGMFYEHDDRIDSDEEAEARLAEEEEAAKRKKRISKSDTANRWGHDKFMEMEQTPKSKEELVDTYGYDIRGEDNAPRARRRRRYGRGPNKYTRNWEDEEAYALAQGRGRGGKKPGGPRRGPPGVEPDEGEYPALGAQDSQIEPGNMAPTVEDNESAPERSSHRGRGGRGAAPATGRGGRGGRGRGNAGSHRGHPAPGQSGRYDDPESSQQPRHPKTSRTVERSKSMKDTYHHHPSKDASELIERRMARTHLSDPAEGPKNSRFPPRGVESTRGGSDHGKKNGGAQAPPKRYSSLRPAKHNNSTLSQNNHPDSQTNAPSSRYSQPEGKPTGTHPNHAKPQQNSGQSHNAESTKSQGKDRGGDFKDQQPPIMISTDASPTYNTVVYPATGVPGVPPNSSFMSPPHATPPPISQGIQSGLIPGSAPSSYINPNGMMNYGPPPVQYTPVTVPISVSLVGVPAGVPPHPDHFVHGAIPLAGGTVPPGTPLIAAQHLGATVVSSPEQVLMAAAAGMAVATSPGAAAAGAAPPPGTQGYAEVRGGVTYFNPTVQPVLNAPRAVSKRPKAAIAIVDPSQMPDGSDGDSPELVTNGGESPDEHAPSMEPTLEIEPTEIAT